MLELRFGSAGAHRVRFAILPAEELVGAVRAAAMPDRNPVHRLWAREARGRLAKLDVDLLVATVTGEDYFPDFLTPPPTGATTTLDEQLQRLRETPPRQVALELAMAFDGRPRPSHLPPDPAAARDLLADQMQRCFTALLEPIWPSVADILAADIGYRAQRYTAGGLAAVFADLHQDVTHSSEAITVRSRHRTSVDLDERGLLLAPRAINWPTVGAMVLPPWPPMLVYPARGVAALWERPTAPSDTLAGVLGRTKARLLGELTEPANTGALARRLALAAGTVSEHLRALHTAGLIAAHRTGRTVEYRVTELGRALLDRNP
jgi:DNA-binding transcriptional ArsR family regulator